METIGLIDADNYEKLNSKNVFPNLALMKISAWHKQNGFNAEWVNPEKYYQIVYMSKVFSTTPDYKHKLRASMIIKGGTGYCIRLVNGRETFDERFNQRLPEDVEHVFPDYSLYGITDTAYGYMSRGCPRGCSFCHVARKEGKRSVKVADLSEFWNGQKYIELCDPNTLACPEWESILTQLADSQAYVDFNQGVDIRLLTKEKLEILRRIKIKNIHFAYDRYRDKEMIESRFRSLKEMTGWKKQKVTVFVLVNFDTTPEQDLDRVMFLRSLNFQPYVMIYDKEHLPKDSPLKHLQRWSNMPPAFWKYPTIYDFEESNYKKCYWKKKE